MPPTLPLNTDVLHILDVVRVPVQLEKGDACDESSLSCLTHFALSCDDLIDFPSLEHHGVVINTLQRCITYAGSTFQSMAVPALLA